MSNRSGHDFDDKVQRLALHSSRIRKADSFNEPHVVDAIPSSQDEMRLDFIGAVAQVARGAIIGHDDFSTFDETYLDRLASVWLDDVKEFTGYRIWLSHRERDGFWTADGRRAEHYLQGCREINTWLVDSKLKQSHRENFLVAKHYIRSHFLRDGVVSLGHPQVKDLIRGKAQHLHAATQNADQLSNWVVAERYVILFYSNIIPAIESAARTHIEPILDALRGDGGNQTGSTLVNCLEAALLVRFLDPVVTAELAPNGKSIW